MFDLASLLAAAFRPGGPAPQGAYAAQGSNSNWLMPDRLGGGGNGDPASMYSGPPVPRPPQAEMDAAAAVPALIGNTPAPGIPGAGKPGEAGAMPVSAVMPPNGALPPNMPMPPPRPTKMGLRIIPGPEYGPNIRGIG